MGNRYLANCALALAFAVFMLAAWQGRKQPELLSLEWLRWSAEAALVGGIADWFAVNALFRRPLGFPWHTALIPRHRGRVSEAVAQLVEKELLNLAALKRRLAEVKLVACLIAWVEKRGIIYWLQRFLQLLAGMDAERLSKLLLVFWRMQLRLLPLDAWLKNAAAWALKEERYRRGIALAAETLAKVVARPETEGEILKLLQRWKEANVSRSFMKKLLFALGEATDAVNLPAAAKSAQQSLLQFTRDLQHAEHPLYDWLQEKLHRLAAQAAALEELQLLLKDGLRSLLDAKTAQFLLQQLLANLTNRESMLGAWLLAQGEVAWRRFTVSPVAIAWLEEVLQGALQRLLAEEHPLIGRLVRQILDQFSDDELNSFIEDKAGEDLQWIRVNGVLLGALAGAVLFALLNFVYRPLLAM